MAIGRLFKVTAQKGLHSYTGVKFPVQLLGLIGSKYGSSTFTRLFDMRRKFIAEDYSRTFFSKTSGISNQSIYPLLYFLNLNRINFGQRSTLRSAVTLMIDSGKILRSFVNIA